ncbi:quinate repressor [Fusarium mundagurra]|uniref:Quinate repressor n=1 Tax=Fusarium mundagurra TaxID=1567541 RepID=A0A8H5YW23_9HYPO|nr:quinate repressor [Fusarium mundagurra]
MLSHEPFLIQHGQRPTEYHHGLLCTHDPGAARLHTSVLVFELRTALSVISTAYSPPNDHQRQDFTIGTMVASTAVTPLGPSRIPTPQTPLTRTCTPDHSQTGHNYAPDASIALIGMRGSGMSTLAVMASSALGFRILDADQYFYRATGVSRAVYKSTNGIAQYRQEELRLMRSMLFDNPTGAVIVCGPGVVEGTGKEWLAEYAKDHLIIYILRDAEEIQRHLRVFDVEKIRDLTRRAAPAYRKLSSFEFYNISDMSLSKLETTSSRGDISPRALALKKVEEDFLQLIYTITRRDDCYSKYKAKNSLSSIPLETRKFTYSLSLPLATLSSFITEFRGLDTEADALELTIPASSLGDEVNGKDTAADRISRQFSVVRRNIRLPLLYHIDIYESETQISENEYFELLHHGLRLAPEYLCVDLKCDTAKIQNLIGCKGQTKIIGHYVVSDPADDGWNLPKQWAIIELAQGLGCDIIRICQEARTVEDNFAAQHFIHRVRSSPDHYIPLIAYNTGRLGRMSCYLNPILSPVTHPLVRRLAPNCPSNALLTVQEAQKAVFSTFLLDGQIFGIYGNCTSKSLSPAMHNAAFKLLGMPHRYNIFLHESMDQLFELVKDNTFGGASITAPFKTAIIPKLDFLSEEAKAIGAVNTLVCLKERTMDSLLDRNTAGPTLALFGENTDWIGIHTCVQRNLSPINAVRRRTTGLIIGAGGMARAAAYALIRLGVKTILIHNRTRSRAEELVEQFESQHKNESSKPSANGIDTESGSHDHASFRVIGSKDEPWPEDLSLPTIVVSCVATREIDGQCSADTSLPDHWLSSPTGGVAIELSYTPLETPLLKQIKSLAEKNWIPVDGLQVLPEQGMMQFELFTTRRAPANLMREEVFRAYKERLERAADS